MKTRGYCKFEDQNIRIFYRGVDLRYVEHYCGVVTKTAEELGFKRHRTTTMMGEVFVRKYYEEYVLPHVMTAMNKKGPFKTEDMAAGYLWKIFYAMDFFDDDIREVFRNFLEIEAIRLAKTFSKTKSKSQRYT